MLVPLLVVRPPPFLADTMATPGPLIWAKVLEKGAMASPWGDWARAATDTTPSAAAVAGGGDHDTAGAERLEAADHLQQRVEHP
jgi:hypothetical protein